MCSRNWRNDPDFFAHLLRPGPGSARLPRGGAESFCGGVHAASLASARRFMSRWRRAPHFVPATWRSLAAASISADFLSGNAPTARALRRTSRSNRSSGLFVRKLRQCSRGNAQQYNVSSIPVRTCSAASANFISFSFTATCSAFCRAAARSSCAWIAFSIAATSFTLLVGTAVHTLR